MLIERILNITKKVGMATNPYHPQNMEINRRNLELISLQAVKGEISVSEFQKRYDQIGPIIDLRRLGRSFPR